MNFSCNAAAQCSSVRKSSVPPGGAGVVHQNVEPAEGSGCGVHKALGVRGLREVGGDGQDLPPGGLADLRGGRLQQGGPPRAYGHVTAFPGQSVCNTFADAGAATRDERRLLL